MRDDSTWIHPLTPFSEEYVNQELSIKPDKAEPKPAENAEDVSEKRENVEDLGEEDENTVPELPEISKLPKVVNSKYCLMYIIRLIYSLKCKSFFCYIDTMCSYSQAEPSCN